MISRKQVASHSRENVTHTLYIYEGVAKGCTCEHRRYQPFVPCSHMNEYNAQVSDVVPHIEDELRGSCCLCGGYTQHIICYNCIR